MLERRFVKADIVAAYALARHMPERLRLPHQPGLEATDPPAASAAGTTMQTEELERRALLRAVEERVRIVKPAGEGR